MKHVQPVYSLWLMVLTAALLCSCRKTPGQDNTDPPRNDDTKAADIISNHLRFKNATKVTGSIPQGPAGSSLKISFKDTLYLVDKWKLPIEFLHEDTTKDVAGVYIQVQAGSIGGTFYYDVPEVPDIAASDTVSMILVGIDPKGLEDLSGVPPAGGAPPFEVTLVPHDSTGQTLGEITVPVEIAEPTADLRGECGLLTKQGESWFWSMSFIPNTSDPLGEDLFFNAPHKLWGIEGQRIFGCCHGGTTSEYTASCADKDKASLMFRTFFNWPNELYKFFEDGTYAGLTEFISADPYPKESNFCGVAPGVVKEDFDRSFLEGTWTLSSNTVLSTLGTSTPQAGSFAARPDGIIDLVSCRLLIIIQPDREGGGRDLVKFYNRVNPASWYLLN
ncbi:MAG: hypothetical protein KF746_09405 [Chitinophagaceae bacterium]|nr:hypothetical protein [Chitinophagaceae bacterium]